jgi:hypothetical protein
MKWAGYVVRMGEGRSVYGVLVGKREGKRPLGRPGHIWEPVDLEQIRWKFADSTDQAHDSHKWRTVVSAMMETRL